MPGNRSAGGGLLVRKLAGTAIPFAVFDGVLPTSNQLAQVAEQGLGVHVLQMPEGVSDLSFLEPLGAGLTALTVTDWSCTDVRAVERLTGLEELHLWVDSRHRTDLASLQLAWFAGRWHKSLESALESRTLDRLMLEGSPSDVLSRVPQGLESLALSGIKGRVFDVGSLAPRGGLRKFDLARAREVRLEGIEDLEGLQELHLTGVSEVVGAPSLSRCRSLRKLVLADCKSVEGVLAGLEAPALEQVLVIGKPSWLTDVDRVIAERGLEWATPTAAEL